MAGIFEEFQKKKEFLVCIDSDGCAMDTMDIKHIRCFGPCMVREWKLEPWEEPVLKRWNEINLYTMTRGINRFKGLELALREVDSAYCRIEDLESLTNWITSAEELSGENLKRTLEKQDSVILRQAFHWSEEVNRSIVALPEEEKVPFLNVKEGMELIHKQADIAVVSSANQQAIMEEWKRFGLLEHTDLVLSQDAGSKAFCISRLLELGYERAHVLMVGDAPGDLDAALSNGVLFYPILVKREGDSWKRLMKEFFLSFLDGRYQKNDQKDLIHEFQANLNQ